MIRSARYLVMSLACLGMTCAKPVSHARHSVAEASARPSSPPVTVSQPAAAPRSDFAPSPVTPLADTLKKLLIAALDGRPLPESPPRALPTEGAGLIEPANQAPPKSSELAFVAFIFRIVFETRDDSKLVPIGRLPDGGSGPATEPDYNFSVLVILDATELSIAQLRFSDWQEQLPESEWLAGTQAIGRDLFALTVEGKLPQKEIGEPQRSSLGPVFFEKLQRLRPTGQDFAHARDVARLARVVRIESHELYLMARDARSDVWSFAFSVVPSDVARLKSAPLIRVERLTP